MRIINKIKDVIFKIKDYDRLESDYCTCLCYFTNNKMSKPNYRIDVVKEVIMESISEYMDEGYNHAIEELQEKIAQVKKNGTWDGVDVDEFMREIRGE